MKISIYINDRFVVYRKIKNSFNNIDVDIVKKIYDEDDLFILRGEPTLHPEFHDVLNIFKKNYVLTTDCCDLEALKSYKKKIPYVSFSYDGFLNDSLRVNKELTWNIMRGLEYFTSKKTETRLSYTISPYNLSWLQTDIMILKRLMAEFPKMKQPYFMLYQEGTVFQQKKFSWPGLSKTYIDLMNRSGLLTQKNLDYLLAWHNKKNYRCISPQNELIIMPDNTVRLCQSIRMHEVLGDLNNNTLDEIKDSSKDIRKKAEECQFKARCWMSMHLKDNIAAMKEKKI